MRSRTVENALRAVGQTYAGMETADPRMNRHGEVDFRITSLLQAWRKADDPPSRVKPLPLAVVAQVRAMALGDASPLSAAAAACLTIGFFLLLRPGEYLGNPRQDSGGPLFRLRDVQLWIGSRSLDLLSCSDADILAATFATLTFTQQKNGVRNENIGHGRSGHPHLCPVLAIASHVLTLRSQHATLDTPLNAVRPRDAARFRYISASDLTQRIRAVLHLHPDPAYAKLMSPSVPRAPAAPWRCCVRASTATVSA